MKILITGASGFLGSHLVKKAVASGFETFAGVRASSNTRQFGNLSGLSFVNLPYTDKEKLKSLLSSYKEKYGAFDYIIHNAGLTKCKKKCDFDTVNYLYTKNLVEALVETGSVPEKFLFISSLGALGPGCVDPLEPITCHHTPNPNTLYGESKLKAEKFIESIEDFPYLTVRPTGIYGADDKEYNIYIDTIQNGIEPYLGFKPQYISFIYVDDLVNLIFTMLGSPIIRKSYVVSDGKTYTQQDYAAIVKKHLNKKTIKIVVPLFLTKWISYSLDFIGGLFGIVPTLNADKYKILSCRNWICDISELEHDFGFKPRFFLDEGVKATVEGRKNQK